MTLKTTIDLLSNQVAAERLQELVPGKTQAQWMTWLQNNRNQTRTVHYRIPFERMSGGIFYTPEALSDYADWENQRQLGTLTLTPKQREALDAFGIGTTSGSATGRKLKIAGITPQADQATQKLFIQFIVSEPFLVFRLEPAEAQAIIDELQETVDYCNGTHKHKHQTRTVVIE